MKTNHCVSQYAQSLSHHRHHVAISRVKSLASCVIEPMTYERLTSLKSSANLQYRLEEKNRLDHLAQATSCAFRTANYRV